METAPVKNPCSKNGSQNDGWLVRWRCWAYALGWLVVLAVAGALRLPVLDRRPMHPDEANQAWKAGLLWQTGLYRYDPAEHHGPTLYYLTLPVLWLAGPADFAQTTETHYRLVPALAGLAGLAALLLLRKALGDGPVLCAAGLTALSPVMAFYSRYYIQETLLVLFTLAVLGCVARWRQASSLTGAAFWAALCGGMVGLMAATKETWILALAAMAAAGLLAVVWNRWIGRAGTWACPTHSLPPTDPTDLGPICPPLGNPGFPEPIGRPAADPLDQQPISLPPADPAGQQPIGLPSADRADQEAIGLSSADPARQQPIGLPPRSSSPSYPAGARTWILPVVLVVAAFLGVTALFYTSFGAHPEGLGDALGAYRVYMHRGLEAGPHQHPPLFYLERLLAYRAKGVFWTEGLIFLLAAVGLLGALGRSTGGGPPANRSQQHLPGQPHAPSGADGLPTNRHETPLANRCPSGSDADGQRFARFLAFYTVILTLLYSAIPYKTPWCAIQFWQGWILLAGVGGERMLRAAMGLSNRLLARLALVTVGIAMLLGVGHLAWQSGQLNLNARLYADGERNPWVYAHTATHVLRLAERMEQLAAVVPEGRRMSVHVVVPDNYWPLPWYLRRLDPDRVGYWASAEEWIKVHYRWPPPHVLIVQTELADSIEPHLPTQYNSQMLFRLRPEVFLRVYVRQDVWEAFLRSVGSAGQ